MSIVTDRGVTCSEYVHCDGIRKRANPNWRFKNRILKGFRVFRSLCQAPRVGHWIRQN